MKPRSVASDAKKIAATDRQICVLGAAVSCSGHEADSAAVEVAGTRGATDLDISGTHACVRLGAGIACWGERGYLGAGWSYGPRTPELAEITDVEQIVVNAGTICARRGTGTVACWGRSLDDPRALVARPTDVPTLADAVDITISSRDLACARRRTGTVVCWGKDTAKDTRARPIEIPELANVSRIWAIGPGVCGARRDGTIACALEVLPWVLEQVVTGTQRVWSPSGLCVREARATVCYDPQSRRYVTQPFVDLAAKCMLLQNGRVDCYERVDRPWTPVHLRGITDGVAIGGAPGGACVVRRKGTVACWQQAHVVTPVAGLTDVVDIAGSNLFACARKKTRELACWGAWDQLGNGTPSQVANPIAVVDLAL